MKSNIVRLILSVAVLIGAVACGGSGGTDEPGGNSAIVTDVKAEASMLLSPGGDYRITATGAQQSDILIMEGKSTFECAIVRLSTSWFRFAVPENITDGRYNLSIRRGEQTQELFTTNVTVQSVDNKVPSKQGYNLKGMVYCGSTGVEGVLVTDGIEITQTNADGHYWLNSKKSFEVVYVILPTGYNVPTQAAMPKFWAQTSTDTANEEQHDFELIKQSTDSHTVLVATDIHLTNRNLSPNDRQQFRDGFVNELITNYTGKSNVYCLNLGDFAHDVHWYKNDIGWASTLNNHPSDDINGLPCQFWSTMGNHDNDGHTPDGDDVDLRASGPYRKMVGPTHVAMNIGKVHYMLLDDIIYYNGYTGSNSAGDILMGDCNYYADFREEIFKWVEKDLSYVDKSTPILVGLHIPLVNWNGTGRNTEFPSQSEWERFVNLFKDFKEVDFITGHTHQSRMRGVPGYGTNMYEHNIGAVCGVWWSTSQRTGGTNSKSGALNLCADGTPSGYYVYEVNGSARSWYYKYIGEPASKQFISYDMNEVKKYYDSYGPAKSFISAGSYTNTAYGGSSTVNIVPKQYGYEEEANTVWINVWGYEHGSFAGYGDWEITVTENGKQLEVTQVSTVRDPLSALGGEVYVYGVQGKTSFSATTCSSTNHKHIFRAVASSANSTLTIRVKDRFGNVYQESMERPKKFYDGTKIDNTWTLE
ncbi:MAG: calcineurin-like phosphoesterase C-terminal domain-containing protein [Alistipes sp.]|nr:calcineurin-like phosphoesterase C-terminal domain-containing protein [Alistipes sp.]